MVKKIFNSAVMVASIVLAVGLAAVFGILYNYFGNQITTEIKKEAVYLKQAVEMHGVEYLENLDEEDSRITYIAGDGTVLYDNQAEAESMGNHADREEVQEALSRGIGKAERMSDTLAKKTIYYALRLEDGTVLRISSTQDSVLALLAQLLLPAFWVLVLMVGLAGAISLRMSKKVVEPLNNLDLEHPEDNIVYEEVEPLLSKIYKQNKQIRLQLEDAKQQQQEFQIITENMQEGLLVIDKYTKILSGNGSVWKIFGQESEQCGESAYSLNRSEEFRRLLEEGLSGKNSHILLTINEKRIQGIINPVFREETVVGAVVLFMNVTEQVEREKLRREFSANVSHELKTPLTSISGYAEIIQKGYVKNEDIQEFVSKIYKEAQRLICLVEDTIRISQLDEDEVPYTWEYVDLQVMARNIAASLKEKAAQKNVRVFVDSDRTICYTVRQVLEEVLFNLCENAIKYNKEDGVVSIKIEERDKQMKITVQDTGIGIPKADQERVFERFYRVDKSHCSEVSGTGLGLSIVKHGVSYLGGEIQLASEEGKGTTMTVSLPQK